MSAEASLPPPARSPGAGRAALPAAALGVALGALGLYLATVAPAVGPVDSGELTLAAASLGVAHPPGFPLWVLLAHLFTRFTPGNVAWGANLSSAVGAAAAAGMLTLAAGALLGRPAAPGSPPAAPDVAGPRRRAAKSGARTRLSISAQMELGPLGRAGAAALAGAWLAVSHALWSFATVAEVYALNSLLLAAILAVLAAWRGAEADAAQGNAPPPRLATTGLPLAGLLFGLALGVHHVTIALALPACAALVLAAAGWRLVRQRRFASTAAVACAAALGVYAWVPWAAARLPAMNWGQPTSFLRLWWHVTGHQYQSYLSLAPAALSRQVQAALALLARQLGPPWVPLALGLAALGAFELARRDRAVLAALGLLVGADLALGAVYEIAEDKEAYYLPTVVALALAAAVGAAAVLRWARHRRRVVRAAAAGLLGLVPALAIGSNFAACDRHRDFISHDYVANTLATVEPNGLLLTTDWLLVAPLLYRREVEGFRRDVVAIDLNLLRRSWYLDGLARTFPEAMARVAEPLAGFRADLEAWERDPELYQRDAALNQRIGERFSRLVVALVEAHPARRYATLDVLLAPDWTLRDAARELATRWLAVPQGLTFELTKAGNERVPAWPAWSLRGLGDGTVPLAAGEPEHDRILATYVAMLVNRGRYLALHAQRDAAARAYAEAQALDPASPLPRRAATELAGE